MKITIITVIIIAAMIVLLLIIALFTKRTHFVKREIIIQAPRQEVFDYLKFIKNQDSFNTGAMEDADRIKSYSGIDGTAGFIYAWKGNKAAGEGEKEIRRIVDGERIEIEIRFVKPMAVSAAITLETEALSANQTRVSWSNEGTLKYPINLLVPMVEKHAGKEIDASLAVLKKHLEK